MTKLPQRTIAKANLGDRSLFPHLSCTAYLAHAAIAPLSDPVCDRIAEVTHAYARGGMTGFVEWAPRLQDVRQTFADYIGADPHEIAFVSNTTHGVIDIAFGLPWKKGDRVIVFDGEFPANVTPWQQAAEEFQLELCWQSLEPFHRSKAEGLAELERALERGIRLVTVSAVQYKTGLRMPMPEIAVLCRRYDAELFVDAIQAVGASPIDVSCGIDYLSTGSHKHLMGAEGAGFLYVAEKCAAKCRPRLAGWLSHQDPIEFLIGDEPRLHYDNPLKTNAEVFEIGTANVVGFAALGASIELLSQFEQGAIHAHVNTYLDALEQGLVARGFSSHRSASPSLRSTLLSVELPEGVPLMRLSKALGKRGVICNTPDGLMRFAPHWPNHLDEVTQILAAVDQALVEIGVRA